MDHTARIEKRLGENAGAIKTYKSHQMARGRADNICARLKTDDTPHEMEYLLVFLPRYGRYTPVFCLSAWFARNNTGGYLGFLSDEGFYSI